MITAKDVVVIDYGMGNLWSVSSALKYLGFSPIITQDPDLINNAHTLILPGVGSFRKAINSIHSHGLFQPIDHAVRLRRCKILGICLGFQLMALSSTEGGNTKGFGFIPAAVERFSNKDLLINKLPHIGFNLVTPSSNSQMFSGFTHPSYFYFVHSYRMLPDNLLPYVATCKYGDFFVAAYQQNHIFGTQFHPEKSQSNGLMLLNNFLNY